MNDILRRTAVRLAARQEAVRTLCARMARDFTGQERAQYGIQDNEPTCPAR